MRLRKDIPAGAGVKLRSEGQNSWLDLLKIRKRGFCSENNGRIDAFRKLKGCQGGKRVVLGITGGWA